MKFSPKHTIIAFVFQRTLPTIFAIRGFDRPRLRSRSGGHAQEPALSLLELGVNSENVGSNGALFPVNVTYDVQHHNAWEGVTLLVDNSSRALRAVAGLNASRGVAWCKFDDKLETSGWTELVVEATDSTTVPNDLRMYGAGFIEGLVTAVRMSQFYANFYQLMMKDGDGAKAMGNIRYMFYQELEFLKKETRLSQGSGLEEPQDTYWQQQRYILLQLWGIKDGYNAVAAVKGVRPIDLVDMLMINSHGELPELLQAYTPQALASRRAFQAQAAMPPPAAFLQKSVVGDRSSLPAAKEEVWPGSKAARNWTEQMVDDDWEKRLTKRGHCSAFVRYVGSDLMIGHTTWSDYSQMTRVFKYYDLPISGVAQLWESAMDPKTNQVYYYNRVSGETSWDKQSGAGIISFSSYPGCVSSTDDFYLMDSGLAVMDTSLEVLNPRLYDRVREFPANPKVPNFMHVMATNRMAKTGTHWTSLFSERNSGTNNAQWLIVDYNKFIPGEPVQANVLRLLEQIPGLIRQADLSSELASQGYWASYNRPFFKDVRDQSGHTAAEKAHGALYSFDNGPRASIFKSLGLSVNDLKGMRKLMTRNQYPMEPALALAQNMPIEPGHAISARMDLEAPAHIPNGGIDAKVSSYCLFRRLQAQAISGPSHDAQPVFRWKDHGKDLFPGWPHLGLPDEWNFNWVQATPTKLLLQYVDPKVDATNGC